MAGNETRAGCVSSWLPSSTFNWQTALKNWQQFYLKFDICCLANKEKIICTSWRHVVACLQISLTFRNELTKITTVSVSDVFDKIIVEKFKIGVSCQFVLHHHSSDAKLFCTQISLNNFQNSLQQSIIMCAGILSQNKTGTKQDFRNNITKGGSNVGLTHSKESCVRVLMDFTSILLSSVTVS